MLFEEAVKEEKEYSLEVPLWQLIVFVLLELLFPFGYIVFHMLQVEKTTINIYFATLAMQVFLTIFAVWGYRLKGKPFKFVDCFAPSQNKAEEIPVESGLTTIFQSQPEAASELSFDGFLKRNKRVLTDIVLGFTIWLGLFMTNILLALAFPDHHKSYFSKAGTISEFLLLFMVVCIGSICEEIRFRQYFFKQMLGLTNMVGLAIIIQAIFFVLIHGYDQGIAGYLMRFIDGLAFGLIALRRNSLIPSMTAHLAVNLFIFAGYFYIFIWQQTHS